MSLTDGTRKMSKSDPSEFSRIHLLDSPDAIRKKIQKPRPTPSEALPLTTRPAQRPTIC